MHAHWGDKAGCGSEHRLDGKMFDAELHIVHYNSKYGDPNNALDKPDGLAVLGMFIKTGAPHQELGQICRNLMHIGKVFNKNRKHCGTTISNSLEPNFQ